MRALVKYAPGPGHVAIREVPVHAPGAGELLIRVRYCGICGTDLHIYADEFPNDPPVIMGHEYCGTVVAVGEGTEGGWAVGDRVVGELHTGACGVCALCRAGKPHICPHKLALGSRRDGAFAEYLTLPAWLAHRLPEGVPWEVAGVTEPFAIGAHCLVERGALRDERGALGVVHSVLISGAATMGLMATIWASRLGVAEIIVAGTDIDEAVRFSLARRMGATRVVNVQREDLGRAVAERTEDTGVDAWIECSGSASAIGQGLDLVRKTGKVVLIGLVGPETIPVAWNALLYKELDLVGCFSSPPSSWVLALAAARAEAPKLRQLVTHVLPLDAWEDGFAMMRTGEAVKILVDMEA
ncbi:MAG: alcohol dehydrogenase catalytic domain-containing protein [Anaerolineae bacterium]|nr:alcohol dehydrogenase catalytic domain-containing protein [Anaerolineae bacterium]